jgi:hypothetical protein
MLPSPNNVGTPLSGTADGDEDEEEEAGYRFASHAFRPGEYVSIRGEDGELHTFQVVSVEAAD